MVKTKRKIFIASSITALACMVFVMTLVRSVAYYPEAEIPLPSVQAASPSQIENVSDLGLAANIPSIEYPVRISIPSIDVDAKVQQVGIAKSGNMAPPNNFSDVGWYKYGTVPGYRGSAVFAGHVDNALALAGVFKHLEDVQVGDEVIIKTGEGNTVRFRVSDTRLYDYTDVPTELIFNQNDRARIRLITCSGSWIQSVKSYDKRLVVTAELMN